MNKFAVLVIEVLTADDDEIVLRSSGLERCVREGELLSRLSVYHRMTGDAVGHASLATRSL